MGKLFNAIKNQYNELATFQTNQENNHVGETTYTNLYNAVLKVPYINFFLNEIQNNAEYYFKSNENFKAFLDQNREIFPGNTTNITKAKFDKNTGVIDVKGIDYEKILDTLEEKIGEANTNELLEKYKTFKPVSPKYTHPFKNLTSEIINGLDELKLNEDQIKNYTEALNYANEELVVKSNIAIDLDEIIDVVNTTRELDAKSFISQYSQEIGADVEKINEIKSKGNAVTFKVNDDVAKASLVPFYSEEPTYTDEFKNKILELDKLVTEKGLIPNGAAGESGNKEYGFLDYYAKSLELKDALIAYRKLTDTNERAAQLENIYLKTNELKEVTNKYNEVMDFIKENFDTSKIGLNGNIYSGRKHDCGNRIDAFFPNFPNRWDYENAGFSVILNGYAQLKGAAKLAGVSIEEYINNPNKSLLKGAKNAIKEEDEKYIIPSKDENGNDIPLGKRIARIAVMDENAYVNKLEAYRTCNRGVEFLNSVSEYDDNTKKNIISAGATSSLIYTYDHSGSTLFNNNPPDYDSIQNLFALGNDTDNLLALSKNYFHEGAQRPDLDEPYKLKIDIMKNVNPANETRRVLGVLKDFLAERNRLYVERREDPSAESNLNDEIEPEIMFVAAKKYMSDFIYKNNINLLSFDKKIRNEVMDFLNDPIKAFVIKYEDEPNLLRTNAEGQLLETFNTIDNAFKKEYDRLYKKSGDKFVEAFNDLNKQTNGKNVGKSIAEILEANKGGFLERKFDSSSKEYKALEKSVLAATDPKSRSYGDLNGVKVYAQKYLDHKLPAGANFEKLSTNEQRRVEFCFTLIGATNQMNLNQKMTDSKIKLAPDNEEFQEKVKNDVDISIENNNIIEDQNEIVNENIITQ